MNVLWGFDTLWKPVNIKTLHHLLFFFVWSNHWYTSCSVLLCVIITNVRHTALLLHTVSPALQVVNNVRYTPLEPGYQPPNYRAASPVTLTCRAVGVTGQIRYHWTSTCRSSCFVPYSGSYEYSYGTVTRSRNFLRYYDAGTHRCYAYDSSQGISGSASTVMKVVGEIRLQNLCLYHSWLPIL